MGKSLVSCFFSETQCICHLVLYIFLFLHFFSVSMCVLCFFVMGGQLRWDDAIVGTVLTNGHVPRAPEFFSSFFEGPFQLAVVK